MNQHMTEYLRLDCRRRRSLPPHPRRRPGLCQRMTKALDGETLPKDLDDPGVYLRHAHGDGRRRTWSSAEAGPPPCRSSTAIGKPAVLVPSPYVTNNHQEKNAKVLAQAGGAVVLLEPVCSGALLYKTTKELLADAPRRERMAKAMAEHGHPRRSRENLRDPGGAGQGRMTPLRPRGPVPLPPAAPAPPHTSHRPA